MCVYVYVCVCAYVSSLCVYIGLRAHARAARKREIYGESVGAANC